MDSVPLDVSVTDFVLLVTLSRSQPAPSVPVPFPHPLPISIICVPNCFVSLHSPNLVHFVLSILLVETS